MSIRADDVSEGFEAVRFAIRQVGAGWTVYDYRTLEPVRLHGRLQSGLERDAAQALADDLTVSARRIAPSLAVPLPRAA